MKYKIGNVEVEAVQFDGYNLTEVNNFLYGGAIDNCNKSDYIVKTEESLFTLSEQDFNNMVTKMKEPKFEVGDKVYWLSEDCEGLSVDKVLIQKIISDKNSGIIYDVGAKHTVKEKYLLTLEEAIEKLEEL